MLEQCQSSSDRITCTKAFEDSPMFILPLADRFPIREAKGTNEHARDRETAVGIQQFGGASQRNDRLVQVAIGARVGRSVIHVALDEHSLEFLHCHRDGFDLIRAGPVGRATEGHVERPHFDGACCFDGTCNALLCEVPHAIPVFHVVVDDTLGHERRERSLDIWHSHAQPMRETFQIQDFVVTQSSQNVFTEADSDGIGVPGVQLTELSPEVGKGTPVSGRGLLDLSLIHICGKAEGSPSDAASNFRETSRRA